MRIKSTIKSIICLLTVPLFGFACSNDMPVQGFNPDQGFDENDIGAIRQTVVDSLTLEFTFTDSVINTGSGALLPIGIFDNIQSQILMRFSPLPDTVDILRSTIILQTNTVTGPKAALAFDVSVHEATASWTEDSVTFDNFQNAFDMNSLGQVRLESVFRVDSTDVEVVRIDLDDAADELLELWADSTSGVENNGFLINPNGSGFFKQFHSSEFSGARAPVLEMQVRHEDGDLDTLTVRASSDAALVSMVNPGMVRPADRLYVDHVFNRMSVIKFDLSEIPREATINRAIISLGVDQENSLLNDNGFAVQAIRLDNRIASPDSFSADKIVTPLSGVNPPSFPIVTESTERVSFSIRGFVQGWVNETFDYHGFLLRTATPGRDVVRVAFFTSSADSLQRPQIEIDYTVPPTIP